MSARRYLIDRFQGDAATLRERVASLSGGTMLPGPDLATSRQMADACDAVVTLVQELSAHGEAAESSAALLTVIPTLEARSRAATHPAVRAVFAGAIARIREVHAADEQASGPS